MVVVIDSDGSPMPFWQPLIAHPDDSQHREGKILQGSGTTGKPDSGDMAVRAAVRRPVL